MRAPHVITVGPGYRRVRRGSLGNGHRPVADPRLRSAVAYGRAATAVILSGTRADARARGPERGWS
jgi:chemotaxis response regulator CheB